MSKVPWHAVASLLEAVDQPFLVVVKHGTGYKYYSGFLRTCDKYGNITLSDVIEHVYHGGYSSHKQIGNVLTVFGDSIYMCGRYDKTKEVKLPEKPFDELEREYNSSIQF